MDYSGRRSRSKMVSINANFQPTLRTAPLHPSRTTAAFIGIVALLCAVIATNPPPVTAQTTAKLIIAERILVLPGTTIPFPIQYEAAGELPRDTFLRIRGLPVGAKLSEGYRVSKSTWAVPLDRLDRLRIQYPKKPPASSDINVQLVSLDGAVHAARTIRLLGGLKAPTPPKLASRDQKRASDTRRRAADVMSATTSLAVGTASQNGKSTASPSSPTTDSGSAGTSRAARFFSRGNQYLLQGNISTARLFYRRSADLGMAAAAMALAATYDPNELDNLGIIGVPGDPQQALTWYRRAAELGDSNAQNRIARLTN